MRFGNEKLKNEVTKYLKIGTEEETMTGGKKFKGDYEQSIKEKIDELIKLGKTKKNTLKIGEINEAFEAFELDSKRLKRFMTY